jgi:hypothetical protein
MINYLNSIIIILRDHFMIVLMSNIWANSYKVIQSEKVLIGKKIIHRSHHLGRFDIKSSFALNKMEKRKTHLQSTQRSIKRKQRKEEETILLNYYLIYAAYNWFKVHYDSNHTTHENLWHTIFNGGQLL